MSNLVFDIKEFGLHDGHGLRTTVFLKGCPLSCVWCHNPEGQSFERELSKNEDKCEKCGLCQRPCSHPECRGLGACISICPQNCVKAVGEEYAPRELADKLLRNRAFLEKGGVTFSGGEPLCHPDFILETVSCLRPIKTAVETCGYVPFDSFVRVTNAVDDIFMDIKLISDEAHIKYTGVSNKQIIENAGYLLDTKRSVTFRIPLIPSITDTDGNLLGIAKFLQRGKADIKVELIPYNRLTGAKYRSVGREYTPNFDENAPLNKNTEIFLSHGIDCTAF